MKISRTITIVIMIAFIVGACTTSKTKEYTLDWESLKTHKTPEWFTDAKFGIYFHWGVYSVPAYKTEWYPHYMYLENYEKWGGDVRPHHIEKYGEDFQYHDFIPQFTAEHFDADEWADLFKAAGAQYAGPVAEHSDGFSMWDSEVNSWNAAAMGPKKDIVGLLEKAIKSKGMKFVTTFHHQWHWGWYPTWNGLVDTSTVELREFYGETVSPETFEGIKKDPVKYAPSAAFVERWKNKVSEVVEKYNPDMLWFDSRTYLIPEKARMEMVHHYYNHAVSNSKGVVLTYKKEDLPKGTGVLDIEGGRLNELVDYPWLTDAKMSNGAWCYMEGQKSLGANKNIDALIDIVSKNGCLLLNISPKADGTIPDDVRSDLLKMGNWLKENGEAIYGSKPFIAYGEGPTELLLNRFGGYYDKEEGYCSDDFRYTTKDGVLYVIQLDVPASDKISVLKTFANDSIAGNIAFSSIELIGSTEKVVWKKEPEGLHLKAPETAPNNIALVYKATLEQ